MRSPIVRPQISTPYLLLLNCESVHLLELELDPNYKKLSDFQHDIPEVLDSVSRRCMELLFLQIF